MSKEVYLFDHDDTLTDPRKTQPAYCDIFEGEFAKAIRMAKPALSQLLSLERENLMKSPQLFSYMNPQGFVIAPSTANIGIMNRIAAQNIIREMRIESTTAARLLPDEKSLPIFCLGFSKDLILNLVQCIVKIYPT